jgi:hypothetical protein
MNLLLGFVLIIITVIVINVSFFYSSKKEEKYKENFILKITPETLNEINELDRAAWISDSFNSQYKYATAHAPGCSVTCNSKCLKNFR